MSSRYPISRRTVLRGLGAAMALPVLDAMAPLGLTRVAGAAASAAGAAPVRMAAFFLPNGMVMEDWTPSKEGAGFELPPTLKALEPVREQINVLSGLALDNARAKGDGPGDHARSAAAWGGPTSARSRTSWSRLRRAITRSRGSSSAS